MQRIGLAKFRRMIGSTEINRRYAGSTLIHGVIPAPSIYSWTRSADVQDDSADGVARVTLTLNTDGSITITRSAGDTGTHDFPTLHWHDGGTVAGIGNSRWAKKTFVSGDGFTGTLSTSLIALSSARTIILALNVGAAQAGVSRFEFYSDSGGTTKVGEITLSLQATP